MESDRFGTFFGLCQQVAVVEGEVIVDVEEVEWEDEAWAGAIEAGEGESTLRRRRKKFMTRRWRWTLRSVLAQPGFLPRSLLANFSSVCLAVLRRGRTHGGGRLWWLFQRTEPVPQKQRRKRQRYVGVGRKRRAPLSSPWSLGCSRPMPSRRWDVAFCGWAAESTWVMLLQAWDVAEAVAPGGEEARGWAADVVIVADQA